MWRLQVIVIMLSCAAPLLSGCSDETQPPSREPRDGTQTRELTPGTIQYELAWDQTSLTETNEGWSTRTDEGYLVEVDSGYLVTYSVSLVPCPLSNRPQKWHLWEWVVPRAYAGHGDIADQSAIEVSVGQSLTHLEPRILTVDGLSAATYCDAFILFARGDVGTIGPPDAPPLDGVSLILRGRWTAPDGGQATPFHIDTDIAHGEVQSTFDTRPETLRNSPVQLGPSKPGLHVRFVRQLHTLFDGIRFEDTTERNVARRILRNLTRTTRVNVATTQEQFR